MNNGNTLFSGLNLYFYNTVFNKFNPENNTISEKYKSKKGKHLLKYLSFFCKVFIFYLNFTFYYMSRVFILTS